MDVSADQFGPDVDQVTLGLGAERAPKIRPGQLVHRPSPRYIEVPPPYSARPADCRVSKPQPPRLSFRRSGPPAVPQHDVQPPGPPELAALVDRSSAAGDRLAALWALAVHTGCRQGELLGLNWADVDLDNGALTVRRTLIRVRACVPQFGDPKSATSRRTLSLSDEAVAALRAHRVRQNEERLAAGQSWADYGLVFATHLGTPLLQRNVIRDFKAAWRAPACLRRSASTTCAMPTPPSCCAPACP